MVEGRFEGTSSFGAGIVIGARAGRIYIATANHVVRSGPREATDIKVQFHFLPGEKFDARLLSSKNTDLDIAVLSVASTAKQVPENLINFRTLGNPKNLQRGSEVYPLGYPQAQPWGVSVNPEKVDSRKVTRISFQSAYIQQGHSGGALLDSCGDIVGMIVRDRPPNGEAIDIESVLQMLREWNYPVNMEAGDGCAAAPAPKPAPGAEVVSGPGPASGRVTREERGGAGSDITIRYTGDAGGCSLNIAISLEENAREIVPTGNFFPVRNLTPGSDYYEITGIISCPLLGSCTAGGSGDVDIRDGAIYDIVWQNTGFAYCNIALIDTGQ
jgi:hypothetical protein